MQPPSALLGLVGFFNERDKVLATTKGRSDELRAYDRTHNVWRRYRAFCQFRFGYFAFLVMMAIVMFSFTLLMEIFFVIFLPSAKHDAYYLPRSIALLVTLPVVLFFLSYHFEEATRLFFDAIDNKYGALPNFRLALAVVVHYLRHRKEIDCPNSNEELDHSHATGAALGDSRGSAFRGLHKKLLLAAKDDPYQDVGKEGVDFEWESRRDAAKLVETAVAQVAPLAAAIDTNGKNLWPNAAKKAMDALRINEVDNETTPFDVSTFVFVDCCCPVLFELVTIAAFVAELIVSQSPASAFLAYVQAQFWVISAYLILWMVLHFWSSRSSKMCMLVSNYRRRHRTMRRNVKTLERIERSEQLWLLAVGFRFYYYVVQRADLTAHDDGDDVGIDGETTPPMLSHTLSPKPSDPLLTQKVTTYTTDSISVAAVSEPTDALTPKKQCLPVLTTAADHVRVHASMGGYDAQYKLSYGWEAVILFVLVICAALLSLHSFFIGWPIMGVLLIALSSVVQRLFPQIFGHTFRHFVAAFVVLSLVFFSSTFLIGTFVTGGDFKLGPFMNGTESAPALTLTVMETAAITAKLDTRTIVPKQTAKYPACTIDYDGLTVLDLALLADAAYGDTTAAHKSAIENRFAGTALSDWTYVARSNESTDHQVWFELFFPRVNMTVIAVRGTASAADALEDMHYWFGITIMQAVNVFVPFLKQLPRAFVVKLLAMKVITHIMPKPVYVPLLEHTTRVRERVGDNVVITGHSLGGAMAAMVGAKTQTRAVSFSGPGLLYSRGRFGVDSNDVRDYVLTFKPRKDIVPRVDELGGMVQELRCKEKSPMKCHSSTTHICELYLSCGDERRRNWAENAQCLAYQALPADTSNDV